MSSQVNKGISGTSAGVAGATAAAVLGQMAHAQGSDRIKVGMLGCGGRGNGAIQELPGGRSRRGDHRSGRPVREPGEGDPGPLHEEREVQGPRQGQRRSHVLGLRLPREAGPVRGGPAADGDGPGVSRPAVDGRHQGRQARLHGKARGDGRGRLQGSDGGRPSGEGKGPGHRRRHAAAAPDGLCRDDEAHP